MDIAVVDDEKVIREHICALIEEQKPGSRIEAYSTGEELLDTVDWCAGKGVFASENALQYLAIATLLYFSLKKIVWNFHEKEYSINRTELFFILIPAAVGLMICMLLRIIMFTVEDSVPETLYDRYPILVVVIPVILLLSLLSILCGVKLFQDMVCWNREKRGRITCQS